MFKPLFEGHRETCFVCNSHWGECVCAHDLRTGFIWNEFYITDPLISECGRFFVDPLVHYGTPYMKWCKE